MEEREAGDGRVFGVFGGGGGGGVSPIGRALLFVLQDLR